MRSPLPLLLPLVFAAVCSAAPAPQTKPKRPPRVLPGEEVQLQTRDGWTLAARYSPPQEDQYVFILLHGTGGRKEDWYFLAKAMARRGLGVLALDLRGHGGSQNPPAGQPSHWRKFVISKTDNEWNNMTADVDAAVAHLASLNVPPSSIALGGADVGSSIALKYAAVRPQVPMLFMLSPGLSYREVLTVNAVRAYAKRPILLAVGADDTKSTRDTALLYEFAKRSAGPDNTVLVNAEREHGTKMLSANKGFIARILEWIDNPTAAEVALSSGTHDGQEPLPSDQELSGPTDGDSEQ